MVTQNPDWDLVKGMDIDELGAWGAVEPNSRRAHAATVAFQRLQTKAAMETAAAQKEAADAQIKAAADSSKAAKAAEDTAIYTRASARWMMWSVIVLAIASIINVGLELAKRDEPHLARYEKAPSAQPPSAATVPPASRPQ
jgi:hypothetical protein